MAGGRPTDWSQEIEHKAWDYANGEWETHGHAMPSVVGLVDVLNVARSTVYKWSEDESTQFSDILATIKSKQELVLFNRSLTNDYNATIAKLALGKHGYHDKQDVRAGITEISHEDWLDSLE